MTWSRDVDLTRRQLDGITRWHEQRHAQEAAGRSAHTREERLDRDRRMAVLREEHRAIVASSQAQLRDSLELLETRPRALLAHRDGWFADRLRDELTTAGMAVLAVVENGAEAVGLAVAEQPDLVLVEDALPMLTGLDVVREVLACAPATVVGAQVAHDEGVPLMLDAGAAGVWVRRVPPAEVAHGLLGLVAARSRPG